MINLQNTGQSPGDHGDSLRESNHGAEERCRRVNMSQRTWPHGADVSERGRTPQENRRCLSAGSLLPFQSMVELLRPAPSETRLEMQLRYHTAYEGIENHPLCRRPACPDCSKARRDLLTMIRLSELQEPEWYQFRLTVINRIKQRIRGRRAELERLGIGYWRTRSFLQRIHLLSTLDLVCNDDSLVQLVATVSELDWRPFSEVSK